jgi:hypothetical protein
VGEPSQREAASLLLPSKGWARKCEVAGCLARAGRLLSEGRTRTLRRSAGGLLWHDPSVSSARIPIRFGRWKPLLILIGWTPGRSYLEVDPDRVGVRMSWGFHADVPRRSIRSVRRVGNAVMSIGVHGWRGRWLVNGAFGPLVALEIDPPVRARASGVSVRLSELLVSVEDPDAVISQLSPGEVGAAGSSPSPKRRTWM